MKLKLWLLLLPLLGMSVAVSAQSSLPRKVSDVTLLDLNGDPTQLPYWGEKNLMIFYIDPDHHKQNEDFTTDMEENHRVEGENLFGFGVMNLKDAPMIPNGMAPNKAPQHPTPPYYLQRLYGPGRSKQYPARCLAIGRLQQYVRPAAGQQGGRPGVYAQGSSLRCR